MIAQRGTRDKLEKYFDTARPLKVTLQITGRATYDFCCFGVDAADKLSDDRYMIFYNQLRSPQGEIVGAEIASGMSFTIKLDALPQSIQKLVFTGSIDGAGTMGEISAHKISIGDQITASFGGADFKAEKAITSLEIYRKGGWRFNVVARGFNGGLDALLAFYGGEQADDDDTDSAPTTQSVTPTPPQRSVSPPAKSHTPFKIPPQGTPPPVTNQTRPHTAPFRFSASSTRRTQSHHTPFRIPSPTQSDEQPPPRSSASGKISLEKKISNGAPKLISLVKPLKVELEKRNLLDVTARVALVVDMSGSMNRSYNDGTVQEIVNKILPVAVQFDDDGNLDFWFYGTKCERRPSVNMNNYEQAVPADWRTVQSRIGGSNNEPVVMADVMKAFDTTTLPVYVVFITDGGIYETSKIKKLLIEASYMPIFWQFVGVRGHGYGVLEQLDTLSGRYVDNADFFALDDFKTVPNDELYSRLLNEFPAWLRAIKTRGVLDGSARRRSPSERESDYILGHLLRL